MPFTPTKQARTHTSARQRGKLGLGNLSVRRYGNAPPAVEFEFAAAALGHANTPTVTHLDSLGRVFLSILNSQVRPLNGADPQDTYFTYDGAGQRVRKVFAHGGTITERIYLGGYEIHRERASTPSAGIEFERQTLHLMDDQRRVAIVETKTREGSTDIATPISRWRFQLDNHLGSAMIELDEAANVITYEEYHPYGSTAFHTADGAEVSAKRYRYRGRSGTRRRASIITGRATTQLGWGGGQLRIPR